MPVSLPRAASSEPPAAVAYVRISRDREGAGLGVERQEADCRALAAQLGLRVARVYVDNDMSAYSGKRRPAYREMVADLERHPRTVLAWHTDRLHRSPVELEQWIALAEPRGIAVHTVQAGPVDLATPAGRMVARQLGAVARYESEHKSERIKRRMAQKAESGEWLGGKVPFGWRRVPTDPKRLELAPDEAELVASGIRTLLGGGSLRAVVRAWDGSGVPPRASKAWHRRSVRLMLARWRNAGVHEHLGQIGGIANWPAIPGVSVEDVRAVRALLVERADGSGYGNRSAWLLSGIATCATCGRPVQAMSSPDDGRSARKTYRCTTPGRGHVARAVGPIDEFVTAVVTALLARPDIAGAYAATAGEQVDVTALRTERDRARTRLDALTAMFADEDITRGEYTAMRRRVVERIERIEAELTAATRVSPVATLATGTDPVAAWHAADLDVQRAVVRELMTITLLPIGGGRRPFDSATVRIEPCV